jgi:dihydroxyacetone kinase-like predicted kinase
MQAIAALIAYDSEGELDVIMAAMQAETEKVSYAEVTHAVRDSGVSGLEIEAGNVIGLIDGKISQKADSEEEVVLAILRNMIKPDSELITFLYGNGLEEAEASALQEKVMEICPQCEVEMHFGGQPHYSYFISVE